MHSCHNPLIILLTLISLSPPLTSCSFLPLSPLPFPSCSSPRPVAWWWVSSSTVTLCASWWISHPAEGVAAATPIPPLPLPLPLPLPPRRRHRLVMQLLLVGVLVVLGVGLGVVQWWRWVESCGRVGRCANTAHTL